ncbi:hypothetical protein BY996DRAFT_7400163 [Phakopsora pachyrhizi]|nr:hypothetical protein BY996DRAFT_7400163 [Phakopsora pachyrhizi]
MEKTSPVQTVQEMNDIQVEESTKISNGKGKRKAEEIEEDEPVSKSSKSSSLDEEEYEKFLRSQLANPQTIQEHLEAEESLWSRPGYERAAISASSSRCSLMFGGSQETLLTRPSTAASAGRASTVVMEGNLPSQYAAEINQRMNEVEEIMRNLDSEQIGQENSTLEETDEMRIRVLGHSSEPLSPNSSLRSVASQTQYLLDDQASVSEQSQSPEDPDSILERDPEFYNIHQE